MKTLTMMTAVVVLMAATGPASAGSVAFGFSFGYCAPPPAPVVVAEPVCPPPVVYYPPPVVTYYEPVVYPAYPVYSTMVFGRPWSCHSRVVYHDCDHWGHRGDDHGGKHWGDRGHDRGGWDRGNDGHRGKPGGPDRGPRGGNSHGPKGR